MRRNHEKIKLQFRKTRCKVERNYEKIEKNDRQNK